jgi:CRISPR-associated endonuclease/helicase Cas3
MFPSITTPNTLQHKIVEVAERLDGPSLVVIEAPMGEGKTEAALFLADRWGEQLGQRGLYVALPTQATSNQMFGRVRRFLEHRHPGETLNFQLLHGHAAGCDSLL